MYSREFNFIFVHIPKTGGNTIQSILSQYSEDQITTRSDQDGVERFGVTNAELSTRKHSPLRAYRRKLAPELYRRAFKFTTVRNPWDRMISSYFSPHRGYEKWDRNLFLELLENSKTMVQFMDERDPPHWARRFIRPRIHIDFVMRFERLQQDFDTVCERLGIARQELPHRNKSDRDHYSSYYDDQLIKLVAKKYACEIKEFGYRFERASTTQCTVGN
jgi:hypothetical protein